MYVISQLMGSILASSTLALMFDVTEKSYFGTLPVGSNGQSLAIEIVISFLLMFVISGTSDTRAVSHLFLEQIIDRRNYIFIIRIRSQLLIIIWKLQIGELGGIAVGMTIMLNVLVAG